MNADVCDILCIKQTPFKSSAVYSKSFKSRKARCGLEEAFCESSLCSKKSDTNGFVELVLGGHSALK